MKAVATYIQPYGDGKIFVPDVIQSVDIRTGTAGEAIL